MSKKLAKSVLRLNPTIRAIRTRGGETPHQAVDIGLDARRSRHSLQTAKRYLSGFLLASVFWYPARVTATSIFDCADYAHREHNELRGGCSRTFIGAG